MAFSYLLYYTSLFVLDVTQYHFIYLICFVFFATKTNATNVEFEIAQQLYRNNNNNNDGDKLST